MDIYGSILEVMESYPLQLIVDVNGVQYYVGLREETTVTEAGQSIHPGRLHPGMDVSIRGERATGSDTAMMADSIEVATG